MLTYLLALTVGLGSFALYMAAFFFPEVHRKNDFIWSGVGLFYALVLWVCAARITGGVLLGQTASVVLLGWLGWQTLVLRRQVAPAEQQTAIPTSEDLKATVANLTTPETVSKLAIGIRQQAAKLKTWGQSKLLSATQKPETDSNQALEEPYIPLTPADFASADRPAVPEVVIPKVVIANSDSLPELAVSESASPPEPVSFPTLEQPASQPPNPNPDQNPSSKSLDPKRSDKPTGGFGSAIQQMLGGNKKRESKPVYVRKQFREPDSIEPTTATLKPTIEAPVEPEARISETAIGPTVEPADTLVEDTDLPSDAILESEVAYEANYSNLQLPSPQAPSENSTLQAMPPHPPAPELVEAALMDAEEKHLPASPPAIESASAESE